MFFSDAFEDAIGILNEVLKIDPKNVDALINRGATLHKLGKYQEAVENFDEALKIDPKNITALNNKASSLFTLSKFQEVAGVCGDVLKIDPKNTNALKTLKTVAFMVDFAKDNMRNDLDALNLKGIALSNLGKHQEALAFYDEVLTIDPKNIDALNCKGRSLDSLGKYQEALELFDEVLTINGKDAVALKNKGFALIHLCKYNDALEFTSEIIEKNSINVDALNNMGLALIHLGKYQEVLEVFSGVIKIDPKNVFALFNMGGALAKLGRYQEALEFYDEVLKIDPKYKKYKDVLYMKGFALHNSGKLQEAIEILDQALEINPKDVGALIIKGFALNNLGRYQEAVENFDEALKIDPKNVQALIKKRVVLAKLNRYQEEEMESHEGVLKIDKKHADTLNNKEQSLIQDAPITKQSYQQLHLNYINSELWENKKKTVLDIYIQNDWPIECVKCGAHSNLHSHHNYYIKIEYQGHENVSDIDYLCTKCHDDWHSIQKASGLSQNRLFNEYYNFITKQEDRSNNSYLNLLSKKVRADDAEISNYFSQEDVKKYKIKSKITIWLIVMFILLLILWGTPVISTVTCGIGILILIIIRLILGKIKYPENYDLHEQRKIPIEIKKTFVTKLTPGDY